MDSNIEIKCIIHLDEVQIIEIGTVSINTEIKYILHLDKLHIQ